MVRSIAGLLVFAAGVFLSAGAQTATTTQISTSGSPSSVGAFVTFTATITPAVPDGETVTFYDGTIQIGTATTTAGAATFSTFSLSAKTHTIKATYAGDASLASSSGTLKQVVSHYTSTTTTSADLSPSTFGQPAQFTATVASSGSFPVTGTVTFKEGSTVLGTAKVSAGGLTVLRYSKLSPGTHLITGKYNGNSYTAASVSPAVTQVVNSASTGVTLLSKPDASKKGQIVTFTATVSSPTTPATGTVTFVDGSTVLGVADVASGKAAFKSSSLLPGLHQVVAVYADASNGNQSSSAPVAQVVVPLNVLAGKGYSAVLDISGGYQVCPQNLMWQAQWPPAGKSDTFYTTVVNSPPFFGSSIVEEYAGGPDLNTLYTCDASVNIMNAGIDNGRLHAFETVAAGDLNPDDIFHEASAYTAASWSDQLYVLGLPSGSPVQLQVTINLLGSITCDPATPNSSAQYEAVFTGFPTLAINHYCSNPGLLNQSNTQVINVQAGGDFPINVVEAMILDPQSVQYASTMNANAYMTIQPLTPGAIVFSMSGVDYSH